MDIGQLGLSFPVMYKESLPENTPFTSTWHLFNRWSIMHILYTNNAVLNWRKTRIQTAQRYSLHACKPQRHVYKNCGRSDNVNCPRGRRGAEVITKKRSDHEILSRKFTFKWFLAISRNVWTTKIWSYTVLIMPIMKLDIPVCLHLWNAASKI